MMPFRVLLADRDPALLTDYRAALLAAGACVVEVAASGLDCLARLRDFRPDLLVLDPGLPWGGGRGVLAVLREEDGLSRVPVILLSAAPGREVPDEVAPAEAGPPVWR